MQITSKGQVTIPKKYRDALGLLPYTEVRFQLEDGRLVLAKDHDIENNTRKILQSMRGKATIKISADEVMCQTRGED